MCLSHEPKEPKQSRKGKSRFLAKKARREPSEAKKHKMTVKMSTDRHHHQSVKSSHKKKPTAATRRVKHIYPSTSMDVNAAGKDTAFPNLPCSSSSAPLSSVRSTHQRERSTSECSCTVHKNCNRKHRYVVSHDYHDHASTPSIDDILPMNDDNNGPFDVDDDDIYQRTTAQSVTTTRSSHPGSKSETFPYRLYRMIEDAHAEGNSDIIHFMPHGRAFRVEDHNGLVEEILGRYFHQSKYVSFQRQLNIYGFQKLTVGKDQGAYYNEWFLRGKPGLLGSIKRVRVKGTGSKGAYDPDNEPDLYQVGPWLPEFDEPDIDPSIEKEATITVSNHTMTSISSITKGSQSDSTCKPSTRRPATVANTFEEKMSIPSKVSIPADLGLEALLVADDGPSIVTPVTGTRIFDAAGGIKTPPLPPIVSEGGNIFTSSGVSFCLEHQIPPPVPEKSDTAPESIGFDPVPLKSGDKSNSTGSYFDWSAADIASSTSFPPSLHTFAQDCLSRQPSSSLFRSPSFTGLFDSSTADDTNPHEVSASTINPTAKVPSVEASQDLEDCEDCSSIFSEESVQKFLESVFDNDNADLNETAKPSQAASVRPTSKEQAPSEITLVNGSEIPYAEV